MSNYGGKLFKNKADARKKLNTVIGYAEETHRAQHVKQKLRDYQIDIRKECK